MYDACRINGFQTIRHHLFLYHVTLPAEGQDRWGPASLSSSAAQESSAWDLPVWGGKHTGTRFSQRGNAFVVLILHAASLTRIRNLATESLSCHAEKYWVSQSLDSSGSSWKHPREAESSSLTQVVVFVLWSMKNGRPLGALRTSQPTGRKPDSTVGSGLGVCCGDSSGTGGWGGGGGLWDAPPTTCEEAEAAAAAASEVF